MDTDTQTETVTPKSWAMNIRTMASEGTLRQNVWNDDDEGKHIACILGAARSDIRSVDQVPCAALCMPKWLASITPYMFDALPASEATDYALRYADVIEGWCVLTPRAWRRIDIRFRAFCTRQALESARKRHAEAPRSDKEYWLKVRAVCEATATMLEEQAGEVHGPGEAAHASDAAYAARAAALAADAAHASDAAYAADAADAADAALAAARAAALAAARAAALAALAADAARKAQFDQIITLIAGEIAEAATYPGGS